MNQLPSAIKPEVKFSDREIVLPLLSSPLNVRPDAGNAAQGNDGDQMNGSDVFLRSVDYSLLLPPTGWAAARVSILIPRDPSINPSWIRPDKKYSHREFVVLHDEFFSITEKNHCRVKRVLNMKQKWNITGTTITENNVIVVCNTDTNVNHTATLRTYFNDA